MASTNQPSSSASRWKQMNPMSRSEGALAAPLAAALQQSHPVLRCKPKYQLWPSTLTRGASCDRYPSTNGLAHPDNHLNSISRKPPPNPSFIDRLRLGKVPNNSQVHIDDAIPVKHHERSSSVPIDAHRGNMTSCNPAQCGKAGSVYKFGGVNANDWPAEEARERERARRASSTVIPPGMLDLFPTRPAEEKWPGDNEQVETASTQQHTNRDISDECPPAVPPKSPRQLSKIVPVSPPLITPTSGKSSLPSLYKSLRQNQEATSIMDRGRPLQRSASQISQIEVDLVKGRLKRIDLPGGILANVATSELPRHDLNRLWRQARHHAKKYEIMRPVDAKRLSAQSHELDEQCMHLHNALRSMQHKRRATHKETLVLLKSRGRKSEGATLKKFEALMELDEMIYESGKKLERLHYHRLTVRQKLLEHIAATLTLDTAALIAKDKPAEHLLTPPVSPEGAASILRDGPIVESIKIYAGSDVHALLLDIDKEIEAMAASETI